jgi:hypothetical protein
MDKPGQLDTWAHYRSRRLIRHALTVKEPLIVGAVVLGLCGAVLPGKWHDDRIWRDYVRVRPGMSAAQAETILGSPSWQGKCGTKFPYGQDKNCEMELGYRSAFFPINPLYWVVQLDNGGRVISADWIASP